MSDARQLLTARKEAIDGDLMRLLDEYQEHRALLVDLDARIRALRKERDDIDEFLSKREKQPPRITIKEAILATLDHKPDGLTALEILGELNEKYYGGELSRTSLSPQLSRLKDRDNKITLRGERWIKLPTEPTLFQRRF
jgi:hypothetical protein